MRVLVSLRNLDLFAAAHGLRRERPQRAVGHVPLENLGVAITGRFLERWVECNDFDPDNGSCTGLRAAASRARARRGQARRRGETAGRLVVRGRASAAAGAVPEILPGVGDTDAALINSGLIRWHTCERADSRLAPPATRPSLRAQTQSRHLATTTGESHAPHLRHRDRPSVAATFVFFFACSDDGGSPMDAAADASTCNCPPREPPLEGGSPL
ncbi:MAG: hypothetical protein HS111_12900 [Kofleriaceae bacterium]|nr:hypothetical protein [Kofleriaceae bacterium]